MDHAESLEKARAGSAEISPDVSVFWKPLRRLFEDGNPVDPVTVLFYESAKTRRLPFAAIAKTSGNRLILWPASDASEVGEFADGDTFSVHHVTLEIANGQTHFTRFDANGQRFHKDRGWKLATRADGLKLWLIVAFQVDALEQQTGWLEQTIRVREKRDPRRLEREYSRYTAGMKLVNVNTPPLRGDCLVTAIYLLPDLASFRGPVKPAHFPMGTFWHDWIDGWADGDKFIIAPTRVDIDGVNLLLLTSAPPGQLRGAWFLGGGNRQTT